MKAFDREQIIEGTTYSKRSTTPPHHCPIATAVSLLFSLSVWTFFPTSRMNLVVLGSDLTEAVKSVMVTAEGESTREEMVHAVRAGASPDHKVGGSHVRA